MLEMENVNTFYGPIHILFGLSLRVGEGEVVCLLGRNGAGKTTTVRSIIGLSPPRWGSIKFKGEEITRKETHLLVRRGMGYVPDDRRIFADLTVDDNLELGKRKARGGQVWSKNRVYELFPALKNMDSRLGGHLSGGEQKMLAIARALMGNPDFLLLDEPSEGLAPLLVRELEEQIKHLKAARITVFLAEQNARSALRVSDRGYILDKGQSRYHGTVDELQANGEIRQRYLLI